MRSSGGWWWFVGPNEATLRYRRAGRTRGLLSALRRSGGLRMIELNLVGWTAVLVPGVAAGALTALGGSWPVLPFAAAGAFIAWLITAVVDSYRWRSSEIRYAFDAPAERVQELAQQLVDAGIPAVFEIDRHAQAHGGCENSIKSRMRYRGEIDQRLADWDAAA